MDLNHRPIDFQSIASTAELSGPSINFLFHTVVSPELCSWGTVSRASGTTGTVSRANGTTGTVSRASVTTLAPSDVLYPWYHGH